LYKFPHVRIGPVHYRIQDKAAFGNAHLRQLSAHIIVVKKDDVFIFVFAGYFVNVSAYSSLGTFRPAHPGDAVPVAAGGFFNFFAAPSLDTEGKAVCDNASPHSLLPSVPEAGCFNAKRVAQGFQTRFFSAHKIHRFGMVNGGVIVDKFALHPRHYAKLLYHRRIFASGHANKVPGWIILQRHGLEFPDPGKGGCNFVACSKKGVFNQHRFVVLCF
jgi:hypothetical protein